MYPLLKTLIFGSGITLVIYILYDAGTKNHFGSLSPYLIGFAVILAIVFGLFWLIARKRELSKEIKRSRKK